eukprot:CAMPEP_0170195404 /NCGR_PEP_ID=MMETSP0040_2-20121228/61457_1 /TAXON_ID=641309 /ORGANISM="Lotharella oceanica, Strain CCMP622" /LENGTH=69 /DNA_ID=CAMNT_0010444559 /DNA_START=655 /DNA_END=864 /DNA_ORIENTATION=-
MEIHRHQHNSSFCPKCTAATGGAGTTTLGFRRREILSADLTETLGNRLEILGEFVADVYWGSIGARRLE